MSLKPHLTTTSDGLLKNVVLLLQAIEEHDLFCPGFDLTVEFIEVIGHDPAEHGQKCAVVYCIINSLFPNPFYLIIFYFISFYLFIYLVWKC